MIFCLHGSCHGAWAFRDLALACRIWGTRHVRLIYLDMGIPPPHRRHHTGPIRRCDFDAIEDSAIVLGHSMAGFPISAAAEKAPDRIDRLIYLCAQPRNGVSRSYDKEAPRQPILEAVERTADGLGMNILPHKARDLFYQDCSDADVEFAISNLCTQAIKPQATQSKLAKIMPAFQNPIIRYNGSNHPTRASIDNGVGLGLKRCL